jgi:RsiW-degrading membrane proteinase PrsW (M82 family)
LTPLAWVAFVAVSALPLAVLGWLVRRFRARAVLGLTGLLALGGAATGLSCWAVERALFEATGLGPRVLPGQVAAALLTLFLFVAPMEEAAKLLVVVPVLRKGRLKTPREGVLFAAAVAAGSSAAESAAGLLGSTDLLSCIRAVAGMPAQFFCAGAWGYALGSKVQRRTRWFPWVFLVATIVHALYDHIVFGRGPGVLVLSVPLALMMFLLAWSVLRDVAPAPGASSSLAAALPEPPSLRAMRRALRRSNAPLMLHWIAFGALVNVGVVLAFLAGAVWIGHRAGFDFAAADEADLGSNAPLVLLGTSVLVAFPVAGYLVARASGATSVLEPALSSALAIVLVVAVLSLTAPVALLFAAAVAPVAFGLACAGGWFGVGR